MTMKEQVKLFAQKFDTTQKYAAQCFADVAEFILDMIASGETVTLPGVLTVGVKQHKARSIYDFKTRTTRMTEAKVIPYARCGEKLKRTAGEVEYLKQSPDEGAI